MWWFYFIACENKSLFFLNSPRSTVSLYHCESDNDFSNIDTIRTHSAGHGCEFVTGAETKHKYSKSVCACVFVYVHSFAISPFHRKTPSHSQHTVTKPWHHTYIHTRTHAHIQLLPYSKRKALRGQTLLLWVWEWITPSIEVKMHCLR